MLLYIYNILAAQKLNLGGTAMRRIRTVILLSCVLLTALCTVACHHASDTPADSMTTVSVQPSSTPAPTPVTYTVATISSLQDEYVYAHEEASSSSGIVGAAVLDIDFLVLSQDETWCQVLYDEDHVGYFETKYLTIHQSDTMPPIHDSCYIVPRTISFSSTSVSFDNQLVIKNSTFLDPETGAVSPCLDIYLSDGTLLRANAGLVIEEGTITAPALPYIQQYNPDGSVLSAAPTPDPSVTPVPDELGTDVSQAPTSTPAPVTISVSAGLVTSATGILLDAPADPGSLYTSESGVSSLTSLFADSYNKVIAQDNTIISFEGTFLDNSTVTVTSGTIYSEEGAIEITSGAYLLPQVTVDSLVDVDYFSDGIAIDMMLSHDDNFLGENVYGGQVCLLQQGTLEKLKQAQAIFAADGYTIILYDAYRPYSVTVALYNKYKDGTYVAGLTNGSVHNRGAAVDMSLLDANGIPLEMPSAIHTLNETSNRDYEGMTDTARANMEYMAEVMTSCGFSTINSEWWHFSDTNNKSYTRTDHEMKEVLMVILSND